MSSSTAAVNRREALRIINCLAQGYDPDHPEGEVSSDVLHRPHIIRALFLAAEILEGSNSDTESPKAPRVGKPWTKDEDDELRFAITQRETLAAITERHQRSTGAIIARMSHLGIVEDRNAARAFFRHVE